MASDDQFIQSFDFSTEKFEPYCLLPNKKCDPSNARSLAVFRGDRFSYLEQNYETRNIEIWVTKKEIKIENGKAVEWMNLMKVSVPKWSSLRVISYDPPSYFIDDKTLSLAFVLFEQEGKGLHLYCQGR